MPKILFAGDFASRNRMSDIIETENYSALLSEVLPITSKVDYAILNFEAPVVEDNSAKPIKKCGPNLRCTSKSVKAIKYAGFDMVTLANNHFRDYGDEGVKETLYACMNEGIDTVGGGNDIYEASKILYKDINEFKFAFINCCEWEYSIATEISGGSNPLNPVKQYYAILEAKKKADFVVVIVHGGHEHWQLPSPRMKETYRFFVDAGADAVVNHHQHCYSGYEVYNGKPIFYGLGNFCFDLEHIRIDDKWNYGYMVELDFSEGIRYTLHPYKQCSENIGVQILPKDVFDESLKVLNAIIADDVVLKQKVSEYYRASDDGIKGFLEPLQNRWILAVQHRKLLPSFISEKWLLKIYNIIFCEAHRDKLLSYMERRIRKA